MLPASFVSVESPPMTPALFSAMSRPVTAPMSAVIDPMTRGALLRKAPRPPPVGLFHLGRRI
jgi:hypothetical protein